MSIRPIFDPEELEGQEVSFVGKIGRIIYAKTSPIEPGTFCIFQVFIDMVLEGDLPYGWDKGDVVICKGPVPSLKYSTPYKFICTLVSDKKYGYQYNILTMNTNYDLTSESDQKNFLRAVLTDNEIDLLFAKFEDPISILKAHDVASLTSISGIGTKKANKLIKKYDDNIDNSVAYVKLVGYGLTKNAIDKLVREYQYPEIAVAKIMTNPYILIEEVQGYGWKKCDSLAAKAGIKENDPQRIQAFIKYFLTEQAESEGNTWIDLDNLADAIFEIAPSFLEEDCVELLKGLTDKKILFYDRENHRISLMRYRTLEDKIANELVRINNGPSDNYGDVEKIITESEFEVGYTYTEEQKEAIRTILKNKVVLLSARAGTGKTSSMFPVVRAALKNNKDVEITALSGKASLNLGDVAKIEGKTIHRLLGYSPEDGRFLHDECNKLTSDIIILDELSMVGGEIFYDLIKAIPDSAKLIMLGDENQLESIGLCNLLKDIKNSGVITTVTLNKILRQAAKSGILSDSFRICDGEQIISPSFTGEAIHGELKDFKIISAEDGRDAAVKTLEEYKSLVFNAKVPVKDVTVATCKRAIGETSARVLNEYIQKIVNPIKEGEEVITSFYKDGATSYQVNYHRGDRVLVTKNSYEVSQTNGGKPLNIFNGNLGTVQWVDPESNTMAIDFPVGEVLLDKEKIFDLQLGYAVTTHKLQGSTIPYVIAVCTNESYVLNSKEMLYTQITRAKKYCCLIGQTTAIRTSIKTSRVRKKQTFLSELLQSKMSQEID